MEALVVLSSLKYILVVMIANVVSANENVGAGLFVTVHPQWNSMMNHLHSTTVLEVEEASLRCHLWV